MANLFNRIACRALEHVRGEFDPDIVSVDMNFAEALTNPNVEIKAAVTKFYSDGTKSTRDFWEDAPGSKQYEKFLMTLGGCQTWEEVREQEKAWGEAYRNIDVLNEKERKRVAQLMYSRGINTMPAEERLKRIMKAVKEVTA